MSDFDTLARLLRRWTHDHDPHVRAAVELLIEHETWIRRLDFQRACVERDGREAWINWRKAREFARSVRWPPRRRWPSLYWPWPLARTGTGSRSWARRIPGRSPRRSPARSASRPGLAHQRGLS